MRASISYSALRAPLTIRPARSQVASVKVGSPLPRSERFMVESSASASIASSPSSSPFAPSRRRVRAFSTAEPAAEQAEMSAGSFQRATETIKRDQPKLETSTEREFATKNECHSPLRPPNHQTNETNQTVTCRARSTLEGDDLAAWEATSALVASTLEISEEER